MIDATRPGARSQRFHIELKLCASGMNVETFDALFDPVADALYDMAEIIDPDLTSDSADLVLTFSMGVESVYEYDAVTAAMAAPRAAVIRAGASASFTSSDLRVRSA